MASLLYVVEKDALDEKTHELKTQEYIRALEGDAVEFMVAKAIVEYLCKKDDCDDSYI